MTAQEEYNRAIKRMRHFDRLMANRISWITENTIHHMTRLYKIQKKGVPPPELIDFAVRQRVLSDPFLIEWDIKSGYAMRLATMWATVMIKDRVAGT